MAKIFQDIIDNCHKYIKNSIYSGYDEQIALKIMKSYCQLAEENKGTNNHGYYPYENEALKGYTPMWAWASSKCTGRSINVDKISQGSMAHASIRWMRDKIYYRFDEELERGIQSGGISATEDVPAALLNRLPYSSFFVETRGGFTDAELNEKFEKIGMSDRPGVGVGFFCTISPRYQYNQEIDALVNTGDKVMDIAACSQVDNVKGMYCSVSLIIPKEDSPLTIKEAMISPVDYNLMTELCDEDTKDYHAKFSKIAHAYDLSVLLEALQYILYLCAENNQVKEVPQSKPKPWASKKKKFASTIKILSVSEPEENTEPAQRVFPAPMSSHSSGGGSGIPTGQTKSPHTRRGHWAYRWVGRGPDKELKLRWIRETRVHPELETRGAIVTVKES